MANSVLAFTMAALLKGNAAAGDVSAAEKGLIKSQSSRKVSATAVSAGDEKSGPMSSITARKAPVSKDSKSTDSPAAQRPATKGMSTLQRVFGSSQRRSVPPPDAPSVEADAESADMAAAEDSRDARSAADESAVDAPNPKQRLTTLLQSMSRRRSRRSPAAAPATMEPAEGDAALNDDASPTGDNDGGVPLETAEGDDSPAVLPPEADAADLAADAVAAEPQQTRAADANNNRISGTTACDDGDAVIETTGQLPRTAAPSRATISVHVQQAERRRSQASSAQRRSAVQSQEQDAGLLDHGKNSAVAAQLTPPNEVIMGRSPPQQRTQRQKSASAAASTARRQSPRPAAGTPATARPTLGRDRPQVHSWQCWVAVNEAELAGGQYKGEVSQCPTTAACDH